MIETMTLKLNPFYGLFLDNCCNTQTLRDVAVFPEKCLCHVRQRLQGERLSAKLNFTKQKALTMTVNAGCGIEFDAL